MPVVNCAIFSSKHEYNNDQSSQYKKFKSQYQNATKQTQNVRHIPLFVGSRQWLVYRKRWIICTWSWTK